VITKTTLKALFAGGGVLATWLAVTPNHGAPTSSTAVIERPAAPKADDLNAQATRLRDHVNAVPLRTSTRNPFRFASPKPATSADAPRSSAAAGPAVPAAPVPPPQPSLTLSGIAERNTPQGPKRTAVISGDGQLYLVTEGETVAGRYTVVTVDPDAVVLRDQNGVETRLPLR
jgi:hypothetical protein